MNDVLPEHRPILDKIRELWQQSGGECAHHYDAHGLNTYYPSKDGIVLIFDYGCPYRLAVPEGYYVPTGGGMVGDTKKFWQLFCEAFDTDIIKPQRNDNEVSRLEFQCAPSGPMVKINGFATAQEPAQ